MIIIQKERIQRFWHLTQVVTKTYQHIAVFLETFLKAIFVSNPFFQVLLLRNPAETYHVRVAYNKKSHWETRKMFQITT